MRTLSVTFLIICFSSLTSAAAATESLQLAIFLEQALKESEKARALDRDRLAIENEILARDLELIHRLDLQSQYIWDNRISRSSNSQNQEQESELDYTHQFSTGTEMNLKGSFQKLERTSGTTNSNPYSLDWNAEISQSILKNSFGRAVQLRRRADRQELQAELKQIEYRKSAYSIQLENLYWDLSFSEREIEIRTASLQRSRESLRWIKSRLARSATEKIDLIQAEASAAKREIELEQALERRQSLQLQLCSEVTTCDNLLKPKQIGADLKTRRSPLSLVHTFLKNPADASQSPVRLDALSSAHIALALEARSERARDQYWPDLKLLAAVGSNAIEDRFSQSLQNSGENPYALVGFRLSVDLDFGLKKRAKDAANFRFESAQLQASQSLRASQNQWAELLMSLERLERQRALSDRLLKIEAEKIAEERKRYRNGRSTTFELISFEQDAADAELALHRIELELRKTEAQARLFSFETLELQP
jgi:outer membrane protein TolC